MDWSKAKSILIISFLLLNLSLGYQLYLKQNKYSNNMQWTTNNLDELQELLFKQNIKLSTEIPEQLPKMHFIKIRKIVFAENEKLKGGLEENSNRNVIELIANKSIKNFELYEFNPLESKEPDYLVYYQTTEGYPLLGAKLIIYLNSNGELFYNQNYFEIVDSGLDKQVISSYSALRRVIEQGLIPNGAEIKQIKLSYYGQTNQSNIQILTPVWKIVFKNVQITDKLYVNAMTGGMENVINY
ncbi:hypothetical protein BHF71_07815 [Vulcanibacillus modesticaldus]|uniref:Regulatory protein YycH-like domain-containing protein n=1 Tax=Vulcanibacillus modesticaldus TaxID=337097 RepID=A0A1D2YVA9_9BACI|nr:two-component system regulatory protein YycI [Vulcanibacillus modesticaldus]OEF99659.1 hypothetical protein BHF71_07815 [Vulcanibacillus modesticaldus]